MNQRVTYENGQRREIIKTDEELEAEAAAKEGEAAAKEGETEAAGQESGEGTDAKPAAKPKKGK